MNPIHESGEHESGEHQNCQVEPVQKSLDPARLPAAMVGYLAVGGMGCPRCATRVRNGLLALEGILMSEVFLEEGLAAVAFDPAQVSPSDLVSAVAAAGNDGRHRYQADILALRPAHEALVQSEGAWFWR